MKILISADMEGATGVTWPADAVTTLISAAIENADG
jgi:D-aminopeptidase